MYIRIHILSVIIRKDVLSGATHALAHPRNRSFENCYKSKLQPNQCNTRACTIKLRNPCAYINLPIWLLPTWFPWLRLSREGCRTNGCSRRLLGVSL